MAEILEFTGETEWDIAPQKVIDNVPQDAEYLMVIGLDPNGSLFFGTSSLDTALNVFILEKAKHLLLVNDT